MTEDVKDCIEQAERFLVLREHNNNELIDKLKAKKYSDETIEECLKFLIDCDELNEERYIRLFIRSSNKRHPEGKIAVLNRLFAKKADKNLSKTILDALYTEEYTNELLEFALQRLVKKKKVSDLYQIKQELIKLGFSSSEVRIFLEEK